MFGGTSASPYDDIVNKTTNENLTSENWELILNLCDKVQEEGQEGARNVIAAVLKRLAHRNPNVQLYALSLVEALSKNCGIEVHREIASRAFTQGLERMISDRNTHDKVKRRALALVAMWTNEFEKDTSLGIMEDCYNNLKAKGHKFETPQEPLPPAVDDEIRRKEEEELQRVLEMSMQDRGGRDQWSQYSLAVSGGAGGSGSSSSQTQPSSSSTTVKPPSRSASLAYQPPKYQGGYAPARSPSPVTQYQYQQPQSQPQPQQQPPYQQPTPSITASPTGSTMSVTAASMNTSIVTRVRALHTFEPTEPGELAFEKGDIIKVVDRGYKDWWRGQLKGRTGIFPVNYVEPLPEPTAAELAKEAEQEAAVFAQAVNVEKLLNMLRAFDPSKENLADNEEIQELYRSSMALRPKIVKLIDKYSQKRADLVSMNETFIRARTIFDRMMEDSLARHTGVYDQSGYRPMSYVNPDPRTRIASPPAAGAQNYGWNPNVYDQQGGYNPFPVSAVPYSSSPPDPAISAATAAPYVAATPAPTIASLSGGSVSYGDAPQSTPYAPAHGPGYPPLTSSGNYAAQTAGATNLPYGPQGQIQYTTQTAATQQPHLQPQPPQTTHQLQVPASISGQAQQSQMQQQTQPPQTQPYLPEHQGQQQQAGQIQGYHHDYQAQQQSPQQQPPQQHIPSQTQGHQAVVDAGGILHVQQSSQSQSTSATAATNQQQQAAQPGPPYVFDPNATYADSNVQAWAQYYAQGGKDPAGAVYFVSVPGVTDGVVQQQPQYGHGQYQQAQLNVSTSSVHSSSASGIAAGGSNTSSGSPQHSYQSPIVASTVKTAGTDVAGGGYPSAIGSENHSQPHLHNLNQPGGAQQQQPQNSSFSTLANSGYSPPRATVQPGSGSVASSKPSWVVPKTAGQGPSQVAPTTTSPPRSPTQPANVPSVGGGYGDQTGNTYYSLHNQFAGLSVNDASNNGNSTQGHSQQPHHGVGATA